MILLMLLAFVAFAPTAQAGWRIDRATQISKIVWHHPNVDRMTIRWGIPPAGSEDASAWTYVTDGVVWLDSRYPQEWEPFCSLVLHEAGHLAGAPHSDKGIMTPVTVVVSMTQRLHGRDRTTWYGTDPRCRDDGLPFLRAHGVGTDR